MIPLTWCYLVLPLKELQRKALEKAATILASRNIDDPLEAYKLLVKHEKELGYPVTYDFVLEALRLAEMQRRSIVAHEAYAASG